MITNPFAGVKTAALVIAGVATFGAGFAAAELYENYAPWGIGARLTKLTNALPRKLDDARAAGAKAQLERDRPIVAEWRGRLATCEADALKTSEQLARQLEAARHTQSASRDAAYRLGAASCKGARNATTSASPSGPVPDSLPDDEDLRSILGGAAYAPGAR